MPSRYIRDTTVAAKIEVTYGTDPVPTAAANAMAASNVRITPLQANYVSRDLLRNYFGATEELLASYNKLVSFEVEAVGSGTAGTAPVWAPLLRACGFAETLTATERATYKPITNGQESVTIYVWDSGVLHKFTGAKGSVNVSLQLDAIPKLMFSFVALDGGDATGTPVAVDYSGFKVPEVVSNPSTGDLTLGGTLSAAGTPVAIAAGTTYPSRGVEIDSGIKAEYIGLLGQESVEINDRRMNAKFMVDATAAQEVAFLSSIKAGSSVQSVGLLHGTVVGRRFCVFAPNGQVKSPSKEEITGKRMVGLESLLTTGTGTGNDEISIVTSF